MEQNTEYSTVIGTLDRCWTDDDTAHHMQSNQLDFIQEVLGFSDSSITKEPPSWPDINDASQRGRSDLGKNFMEQDEKIMLGSLEHLMETSKLSKSLPDIENHTCKDRRTPHMTEAQKRAASHNEAERRRRIFLNSKIDELGKRLPKSETKRSRGCIVKDAVEYIEQMKGNHDAITRMDIEIQNLENRNRELLRIIKEMEETLAKHDQMRLTYGSPQPRPKMVVLSSMGNRQRQSPLSQCNLDSMIVSQQASSFSHPTTVDSKASSISEYRSQQQIPTNQCGNVDTGMAQLLEYTNSLPNNRTNLRSSQSMAFQAPWSNQSRENLVDSFATYDMKDETQRDNAMSAYFGDLEVDKKEFDQYL